MEDPFEDDFFSFEGEFTAMRRRMLAQMRQQMGAVELPPSVQHRSIPEARQESRRLVRQETEMDLEVSSDADRVHVVVPIPWAREEDVTVTASTTELVVDAAGPRGFSKTVPLPHRIRPATCQHALKNGLLLISARRHRRQQRKATT